MKTKVFLLIFLILLNSCGDFFRKTDARQTPTSGPDRARKNLEEGRGVSLKNLARGGSTTYEFS